MGAPVGWEPWDTDTGRNWNCARQFPALLGHGQVAAALSSIRPLEAKRTDLGAQCMKTLKLGSEQQRLQVDGM